MPIRQYFRGIAFQPRDIALMNEAFEEALRAARVADRSSPAAEKIAQKLIEEFVVGTRIASDRAFDVAAE